MSKPETVNKVEQVISQIIVPTVFYEEVPRYVQKVIKYYYYGMYYTYFYHSFIIYCYRVKYERFIVFSF